MILVTGGTGLVGSHLLFFLLKEGQTVRATHRKDSSFKGVKNVFKHYKALDTYYPKIEWVTADITDVPALNNAFEGVTMVYHCAGLVDFAANYTKLKKVNVEGTANVVNLCLHHNVRKLGYVSSIAALGESINNKPITEETTWNPDTQNSNYSISKYGAEMEVWRGTQEGLDAIIVQPGVIFGEGHWNTGTGAQLKKLATKMQPYPTGSLHFVDVQDVCKALLLAMNSSEKNEAYLVVGHNTDYETFLKTIASLEGIKPPKRPLEKWKLKLLYYLEKLLIFKKKQLSKAIVDTVYSKKAYDNSKLKNQFSFTYTPLEETLKRILASYHRQR